jgi:hypothetical protein
MIFISAYFLLVAQIIIYCKVHIIIVNTKLQSLPKYEPEYSLITMTVIKSENLGNQRLA